MSSLRPANQRGQAAWHPVEQTSAALVPLKAASCASNSAWGVMWPDTSREAPAPQPHRSMAAPPPPARWDDWPGPGNCCCRSSTAADRCESRECPGGGVYWCSTCRRPASARASSSADSSRLNSLALTGVGAFPKCFLLCLWARSTRFSSGTKVWGCVSAGHPRVLHGRRAALVAAAPQPCRAWHHADQAR